MAKKVGAKKVAPKKQIPHMRPCCGCGKSDYGNTCRSYGDNAGNAFRRILDGHCPGFTDKNIKRSEKEAS